MVLSAYVRSIQENFGIQLKVVLKILTHEEPGKDEVEALAQMSAKSQYCNLYDAFKVTRQELYIFAGQKLEALAELIGVDLFSVEEQSYTIIVLNLVSGEKLIERKPLNKQKLSEDGLIVETENGQFLDSLSAKCAERQPKERLYLLMEMAKALAKRHKLGLPHGDLSPGNVLWDPELNEITLIDLGLNRNFGTKGWRSPEHLTQQGQRHTAITPASDIYVMGQWMSLLAGSQRFLNPLIKTCRHPDLKNRPTANALYSKLRNHYYASFYKNLFLVSALVVVILGFFIWQQTSEPSLHELLPENGMSYRKKIQALDLENMANPKTVRLEIQEYLKHPQMTPALWENLIRTLADYYRRLRPPPDTLFSGKPEDIQAIWIDKGPLPAETWILYKGNPWWHSLGEQIMDDRFLLKVDIRYPEIDVVLEDQEGEQTIITTPLFPYPWIKSEDSILLMFDGSLEKVLENLSLNTPFHAAIPGQSFTTMKGVLSFASTEDLLIQLKQATRGQLSIEGKRLRITPSESDHVVWKLSTGQFREITARRLLNILLRASKLEIGAGEEYILDETYLGLSATDIFWSDLMAIYCLEEDTTFTIRENRIYFKKNKGQ